MRSHSADRKTTCAASRGTPDLRGALCSSRAHVGARQRISRPENLVRVRSREPVDARVDCARAYDRFQHGWQRRKQAEKWNTRTRRLLGRQRCARKGNNSVTTGSRRRALMGRVPMFYPLSERSSFVVSVLRALLAASGKSSRMFWVPCA